MAEQTLTLSLSAPDLAAARAAVATAMDDLVVRGEAEDSPRRLLLGGLGSRLGQVQPPASLHLTRSEAELLRGCVTAVMARQGYFVGRPEGMNTLLGLRRRLDALLASAGA